jgi:CRISPR-associated endonuclease/helicase Cas3
MRGLERDKLLDADKPRAENDHARRVMQRFLKPHNDPSQDECFLISTSAGEVGFDLNADHMVCNATTVDSFIQRLGRVNRRGGAGREATVTLVRPKELAEKTELLKKAITGTLELLTDGMPLSPKHIAEMKSGDWKDKYKDACSPDPITPDLTDILLDNWSMTSIKEKMPGRPEVAPWLLGMARKSSPLR